MALIVEDGSIVTGANTYVSRADYIAYALTVGVVIPDDATADAELVKSSQFIDSLEQSLMGYRVTRDQPIAYPRYDLYIEGWSWAHTEIPRQVILAQLALSLEVHAGEDPFNPPDNLPIIENEVSGAVRQKFATPSVNKLSKTSTAQALLNSLKKRNGLFSIPLVRA